MKKEIKDFYKNNLRNENEVFIETGKFSYEQLIGMPEAEAVEQLKKANHKYRIMFKNGEHYMGTCDYRPERINLSIDDNVVKGYSFG